MEVTGAVPAALEPMQSLGSGNAMQKSAYAVDRTLVDYVATFQKQGLLGQQVGNPAALGSEALRVLDGYLNRVSKLENKTSEQLGALSTMEDKSASMDVATADSSGISPGPAAQMLDPGLASQAAQGKNEAVASIGGTDIEKAVQMLSEILSYSVETQAIVSITSNVTKSTSTLLRGS